MNQYSSFLSNPNTFSAFMAVVVGASLFLLNVNYKNNTRTISNSVYNFTNNKGAAIAKAVGTPATGNPISIILLALILLGLISIKHKK